MADDGKSSGTGKSKFDADPLLDVGTVSEDDARRAEEERNEQLRREAEADSEAGPTPRFNAHLPEQAPTLEDQQEGDRNTDRGRGTPTTGTATAGRSQQSGDKRST
jgi:hypothetical protein